MVITVGDTRGRQTGVRPGQRDINLRQRQNRIAAKKDRLTYQLLRSLYRAGIGTSESGVSNPYQYVSISSGCFDVGSHSEQSLPLDVSKLWRRQAQPQVVVFSGIHQVVKCFHVDRLDAGNKSRSSRSLKPS